MTLGESFASSLPQKLSKQLYHFSYHVLELFFSTLFFMTTEFMLNAVVVKQLTSGHTKLILAAINI